MIMNKLCIFMPCYNAEKYLRETLKSILTQSYEGFVLVAVDDGSTDSTVAILNDYAKNDSRIKVIKNGINKGLPYTRNRMLELCDSEFIALMDSDDIMPHDRLKDELAFMESHPDISVVGGAMHIMNEDGTLTDQVCFSPSTMSGCKAALMLENCFYNGTMMLRKKDVVLADVRYDDRFTCMQDYKYWCDLILKCRFATMNDILLFYRIHGDSVTGTSLNSEKRNRLYDILHREYIESVLPGALKPKEMKAYLYYSRCICTNKLQEKNKLLDYIRIQKLLHKLASVYKKENVNGGVAFESYVSLMIDKYTSRTLYKFMKRFYH